MQLCETCYLLVLANPFVLFVFSLFFLGGGLLVFCSCFCFSFWCVFAVVFLIAFVVFYWLLLLFSFVLFFLVCCVTNDLVFDFCMIYYMCV